MTTIDWASIATVTGQDNVKVAGLLRDLAERPGGPGQAEVTEAIQLLRDNGFADDAQHMENNRFRYHAKTLITSAGFAVLAPVEPDPILDNDGYGW